MSKADSFAVLRKSSRLWAIASVEAEPDKLAAVHDWIAAEALEGDRVVYLGNYIGFGPDAVATLDELIRFRSWFLSIPPYQHPDDIVYLRGQHEEMWWKLMQLQFAPDPEAILDWMMARGMDAALKSFGADPEDARRRAREGTLALTYWTNRLREAARGVPGHDSLMAGLKRATYTDDGALLFVHAGLDISRPLSRQSDSFWWAPRSFQAIDAPYGGFHRIVRGFDPEQAGIVEGAYTLSLDGGAGRGGTLNAVRLAANGTIEERMRI